MGLMRGKALGWSGLLLASLLLVPSTGRAQESLGYARPDTTYPSPLGSTHPAEGPYFFGGFTLFQQTNPIGQQTVAKRGFLDITGDLTGRPNTFVGSGRIALRTKDLTGPDTFAPGFTIGFGYHFFDGSSVEASWKHTSTVTHSSLASIIPSDFVVQPDLSDTFLFAEVFNFNAIDFSGPPNDVNGEPAIGIWNGADLMTIEFRQRLEQYELVYRLPSIIEKESYRTYGYFGARLVWFWERFKWTTFDFDETGSDNAFDRGIYTNIISNRMYGIKIGCVNDWYIGNGLAVSIDTFATPMIDFVKKRAKYERGDKGIGPARKRADFDYTVVGEFGAALNVNWFPTEAVQVRFGYDLQAYLNTVTSREPIDFDFSAVNPTYNRAFRLIRGLEIGLLLRF